MNKTMRPRFYKRLNHFRRGVQIFTLTLLVAIPILNLFEINWAIGTLYSITFGELEIVDPLMALQTVLLTKEIYIPLIIAALLPIVLALVFGRVFCSWACPYNTFAEWLDALEKRFFKKRWAKSRSRAIEKNPRPFIYWTIFAGLILILLIFGIPLMGYLSAPGIISVQIAQIVTGAGLGLEIGFIGLLLGLELILARRFWCKYLCPVGAMLSLFRIKSTLHIRYNPAQCDGKGSITPCQYACPLGLSPKSPGIYPYCFNCGLCIRACEKTGSSSLSLRFGADKQNMHN